MPTARFGRVSDEDTVTDRTADLIGPASVVTSDFFHRDRTRASIRNSRIRTERRLALRGHISDRSDIAPRSLISAELRTRCPVSANAVRRTPSGPVGTEAVNRPSGLRHSRRRYRVRRFSERAGRRGRSSRVPFPASIARGHSVAMKQGRSWHTVAATANADRPAVD